MLKKTLTLLLVTAVVLSAYTSLGTTTRDDATGLGQQQKLDRGPNLLKKHAVWHTRATSGKMLFSAKWSYYDGSSWSTYGVPIDSLFNSLPPEFSFASFETGYPAVTVTSYNDAAFAYLISSDSTGWRIEPNDSLNRPPVGHFVVAAVAADTGGFKKFAKTTVQSPLTLKAPPVISACSYVKGDTFLLLWIGHIEHDVHDLLDTTITDAPYQDKIVLTRLTAFNRNNPQFALGPSPKPDSIPKSGDLYSLRDLSMTLDANMGMHACWRNNNTLRYFYIDSTSGMYGPVNLSATNVVEPQISTYGNKVYIVYRSGTHIIRISRVISDSLLYEWPYRDTLDIRGGSYNRFYPHCRDKASVWQEVCNTRFDIFDPAYYVEPGNPWVSDTSDTYEAFYPNVKPIYSSNPAYVYREALWTQEASSNNQVTFHYYSWSPACIFSQNEEPTLGQNPVYLNITGGDEPQPYALRRASSLNQFGYNLDYDPEELRYEIGFLAPPYDYLARVVASVPDKLSSPVAGSEQVSFDGVDAGQLILAPGTTDTLYAWIPADRYESDRKVELSLKGNSGAPAFLQEFTVYRFEDLEDSKDTPSEVKEISRSYEINLWTAAIVDGIEIHYTLAEPREARIQVFDCSGRQIDYFKQTGSAGENVLRWNEADASTGVYFIRIATSHTVATTKAILLH